MHTIMPLDKGHSPLNLSEFQYELPDELIAQYPAEERDHSRLMIVDAKKERVTHARFTDLPDFLNRGDLLVLNDTRVIPARLFGQKQGTGGTVELLLLEKKGDKVWQCMFKRGKRLPTGTGIVFEGGCLRGEILEKIREGKGLVEFTHSGNFFDALKIAGRVPLPPYIRREPNKGFNDRERYQTVFAIKPGSSAAPTAGLHFTRELINELKGRGINLAFLTLHVGPGTFVPIRAERIDEHRMDPEFFQIPSESLEAVERARRDGARVVAVGSTALRGVEAAFQHGESGPQKSGHTDLFIYPGFRFRRITGLVTNFHLPGTTLFVLACTFAGTSLMKRAYQEAIEKRYRFYSYGDAMVIL